MREINWSPRQRAQMAAKRQRCLRAWALRQTGLKYREIAQVIAQEFQWPVLSVERTRQTVRVGERLSRTPEQRT